MRSVIPIFALLLAVGCSGEAPEEGPRPVAIQTVQGEGAASREFSGTIASPISSELAFQVGGRISQRLVDPGERVKRGQALFRIDPADIALAQNAANANVTAARSDAERASADFDRLEGLVEAGSISKSEFDAARAQRDATAANLKAAEARANETRRQRGYTTLVAPRSGTVTDVFAQPGQFVSAGMTILELAEAGPREAVIAVPEEALNDLPRNATARPLGGGREIAATLKEVSGAADPATRTFRARYRLSGGGADLPIGSTVTIALELAQSGARLAVPLGALHDEGKGPGVWVIDDEAHAHWQAITLLELREEQAIITGELKPGDKIIALGAHLVVEGEEVRPAQIGQPETGGLPAKSEGKAPAKEAKPKKTKSENAEAAR